MKNFNRISSACCFIALGLMAFTSCEGGELFEVDSPDWISDKIQEIEDSKKEPQEEVLEGMQEDVYSFGNTDFTSGWWTAFSKYYVIPDGEKWNAVFNLNINPSDNTYYKNFALIISNDVERGGTGYTEYGAIRFDVTGSPEIYNSQWGNYIDFNYVSGTLLLSPDENSEDPNVQKLGGKITLTVDRTSENAFFVKMTNGVATKTYEQPYKEENLNVDASNTNIRCFLVAEGSYIDFKETNIEPVGGLTSAEDKNPLSMELHNVPSEVNVGTTLEEAMANVTAIVTFEEGVTKTITADELTFSAIPDMDKPGEKILVAVYNKTFKGENCAQPIVANAMFNMVEKIESIVVTTQPLHTHYYYYVTDATRQFTERTLAFDTTGMVVTATTINGTTRVLDNSKLTFSSIPAKEGSYTVNITAEEGITTTVEIKVSESSISSIDYSATIGAEDNSSEFWGDFSDDFNISVGETKSIAFTNYSSLANNWNNFVVVLRKTDISQEYAVVRADNYGWGNGYSSCVSSGGQSDWGAWLEGMNGAKVIAYVTNCGNSTADIQFVITGTTGVTSTQYYLGINTIDPEDLNFAFTIDGCHLVFGAE